MSDTEDWREALRQHIRDQGLRLTPQRMMIAEAFFETSGEHVNIDELYRRVRARSSNVGYATVYRTLKLLEDCGLAKASQFGNKITRFEPTTPEGHDHHDHLICTGCGSIVEFENEEIEHLQQSVAQRYGFLLTHHKMELYGLCKDCAERVETSEP